MRRFSVVAQTDFGVETLAIIDNKTKLIYHSVDDVVDGNFRAYRVGAEISYVVGNNNILRPPSDQSLELIINEIDQRILKDIKAGILI